MNEEYQRLIDRLDSKKFNYSNRIMWLTFNSPYTQEPLDYPEIHVYSDGVKRKVATVTQANRILDFWEKINEVVELNKKENE